MLVDLDRLEEKMGLENLDVLLVSSSENLFYTSGYRALDPSSTLAFTILVKGSPPILLAPISEIGSILTTECWARDRRFYGRYHIENGPSQEVVGEDAVEAVVNVLRGEGLSTSVIGVEELVISRFLFEQLMKALPQAKFKGVDALLCSLRVIKSAEEVDRIRKAVKTSEKVLSEAFEAAGEGVDEFDVANALKKALVDEGAEWTFLEMASGSRSGLPNAQPINYIMRRGEVLRIDFGTRLNGYCSDISRNAVIGEASETHREIHQALLRGEKAAIEAVRPGRRMSEIFKVGQETVRKAGLPRFTRYNLGHGIGLNSHEPPTVSPENDQFAREGMVFTIEVPYYVHGFGGFNVEDILLATGGGCELLSTIDREMYIL